MTEDQHKQALQTLDSWAPNPVGGLPYDLFLFVSRFIPLVNVDLMIKDATKGTLLTWRDDEFYGAGWHVPGGIIRYKETADARIRATAWEELGAAVEYAPEPIAIEQSIEPARRERGHFVSLIYSCRLTSQPDVPRRFTGGLPIKGQWAWHTHCPPDLIVAQHVYKRFF